MGRPSLTQHRKFRRLERILGDILRARGAIEFLWETSYENGDEYLGDSADVEAAARWTGEPGLLTKAFLDAGGGDAAGFIEEIPGRPGRYQVHDLWHHAPEYVRKRRKREAERRAKTDPMVTNGSPCPDSDRSVTAKRHASPDCQAGDDFPPAPAPAPAPAPKEPKGDAGAPVEWIPNDAWAGFVEMRKKTREPLTDRAISLIVKQLERLRTEGHEVGEVLDQSTRNNWKDVYPLKEINSYGNRNGNRAQQRQLDNLAALDAAFPLDR
jgi:hypothetical protein